MPTALVTGGAGFIGSHLVDLLLASGWQVCVVDDLSTGRYDNIANHEGKPNFRLVIDTVLDRALTEELVKDADTVFHLAAAVGVQLIIDRPVQTLETNVKGTEAVLSAARRYRKRVVVMN